MNLLHFSINLLLALDLIHTQFKYINNTSSNLMSIDVEAVIRQIQLYFERYAVRVQKLKEFHEEATIQYKISLGYSKTRWLALLSAIQRILKLFEALQVQKNVQKMYGNLDKQTKSMSDFNFLKWSLLKTNFEWEEVQKTVQFIVEKCK